jgi:hypothetical protein
MIWNWKGFGRKRSWPNFKVLSWHSTGGNEENYENLNQDSQSPGRESNPGPPEYEVGVLSTRPRRLVPLNYYLVFCQFILP